MPSEIDQAFDEAHLPLPPLPSELAAKLQSQGEWLFGTRPLHGPLYDLETYVDQALEHPGDEFLFIGHSGYGANNWHLHYYLNHGPLALFVQTAWGGAFTDAQEAEAAVASYFREIERLRTASGEVASERAGQRLFVIQSDIGNSRWAWVDDAEDIEWESDDEVFAAALASWSGNAV